MTQLCFFYFLISVFLFLIPTLAFSQKIKENDIIPILECIEDNGDGTYTANFGYDNNNPGEITIPEYRSKITSDDGNIDENGLNSFLPGRQYRVFRKTVSTGKKIIWTLIQGNGKTKEVTSSINSAHCGKNINIKTNLPAPEGGKLIDTRIGAELPALNKLSSGGISNNGKSTELNEIYQITEDGKMVMIEIFTNGEINSLLQFLIDNGFLNVDGNEYANLITGMFPIDKLIELNEFLNSLQVGNYARPLYAPIHNNSGLGINTGDYAMYSDFVRGGYKQLDGSGIKIGVFSNSYNTQGGAATDVINDDLPGSGNIHGYETNVDVMKEYPIGFGTMSDEGRAMLQIVHDIAPAAELVFRTGSLGAADFALGINEMDIIGCNIIVDDITYYIEPFFQDGQLADAVDAANENGVAYFTSAGNFADASYESSFNSGNTAPFGLQGTAHDFGGGDIFQSIHLGEGTYTIVLQWEEEDWNNADYDFDIFLTDENGDNLLGYNHDNTYEQPIEVLNFTVSQGGANTNIMITSNGGVAYPRFKYIVFRGFNTFQVNDYPQSFGSSTIMGQANAAGAMTVGSVLYSNTPFYGKPLSIASFSSVGGLIIGEDDRKKPDFVAPNGVETTVKMSNFDDDGDGIFQFHGTSASAPHAAAVAALIMDAAYTYPDAALSTDPESIRDLLQSTALDMHDIG